MLKLAWTAITGALGGIQTYLIVGAITAAISLGAGAYAGYRWEHGKLLELQLANAKFTTQQVQLKADGDTRQFKVALKAAVAEAHAQGKLEAKTVKVKERILIYVTKKQDASVCGLTVGLARILRASAEGSDPGALALASGQSDDDCSDVTPSEVAGWFASYAGISNQNAEQLNALEAETIANHEAQLNTIPPVGDSP